MAQTMKRRDIYTEKGRCFWVNGEAEGCKHCEGSRRRADEIGCGGYVELCRGEWIIRTKEGEYIPLELWVEINENSRAEIDVSTRIRKAGGK